MKKLFNFIFYFSFLFLLSIKPSISEEKIKNWFVIAVVWAKFRTWKICIKISKSRDK